jgi:hypothetical protein
MHIMSHLSILVNNWLPVWEDEDEAEPVYNYMCDLIEM